MTPALVAETICVALKIEGENKMANRCLNC